MMINSNIDSIAKAKKIVGEKAAAMVEDGMLIGLGTGTTASFFIASLINRCRSGLKITAVATSRASEKQAREGGIPFADINSLTSLDICFDGADEIDPQKRMIKGGGGALLREKIVATMSGEMVVLVDESKLVDKLGSFPLPVEICPFAFTATIARIEELGYKGKLRMVGANQKHITDNGNYIFDIKLSPHSPEPSQIHISLISIPGVVETGFFLEEAGRVLIGKNNGEVEIWS